MSSLRYAAYRFLVLTLGAFALPLATRSAADEPADLGKITTDVLSKEQRKEAAGMIDRDIARRSAEVNTRNREEWGKIQTRDQWEKYRDERIERLRRSLGE